MIATNIAKKHTEVIYFNFLIYPVWNAALRNKRECDIVDAVLGKGRQNDAEKNLHCLYGRHRL